MGEGGEQKFNCEEKRRGEEEGRKVVQKRGCVSSHIVRRGRREQEFKS